MEVTQPRKAYKGTWDTALGLLIVMIRERSMRPDSVFISGMRPSTVPSGFLP